MSQFEDIENALKSACINYQETLSWDGVFKNGIKLDNNIFFAFDTVGNLIEITTIIEGKIAKSVIDIIDNQEKSPIEFDKAFKKNFRKLLP